jgi:Holliday junction resolvasome RuvABC endonuclease subunit
MANPKIFGVNNLRGAVAIGVDQSYSGFAMTAIDKNNNYYTEVWKLDGTGVERLFHAKRVLQNFIDMHEVSAVAIEGYAFGSQMANMAGELGGVVRMTLWEAFSQAYPNAKQPFVVAPTSLKKYVAGKGAGVSKSQMMLQVYKKWGVEYTDDNGADSYGLAKIAQQNPETAYEKEVLEKLTSQR